MDFQTYVVGFVGFHSVVKMKVAFSIEATQALRACKKASVCILAAMKESERNKEKKRSRTYANPRPAIVSKHAFFTVLALRRRITIVETITIIMLVTAFITSMMLAEMVFKKGKELRIQLH